jgi:ABC-type lipoprotein export system ATPase subunit
MPLVLVDEPRSRLGHASAELVAEALTDAAAEGVAAIVCATHDRW